MATLKMPFGKHRGKRIISVPSEYLHWLLDNNDEMDADVKKAVVQELERRGETVEQKEEPAEAPKSQPAPAVKSPPRGGKAAAKKKEEEPAEPGPQVEARHLTPLGQRLAGDLRMLFRNLALKYHPDRGGSQDAMRALNDLHDQVQELITRTFTAS